MMEMAMKKDNLIYLSVKLTHITLSPKLTQSLQFNKFAKS